MADFSYTVYLDDTDAGGMVYHAQYLKMAERARTFSFGDMGVHHHHILQKGQMFVVKDCHIQYHAPAQLADTLIIQTHIDTVGSASVGLTQLIARDNKVLATLKLTLVMVDEHRKVKKMDDALREIFTHRSCRT